MRMNDLDEEEKQGRLARFLGNYGSSVAKQFGNRFLPGGDRAEGMLSVADKQEKETFLNDLLSAAFKSLTSEIQSGRVDPNLKSPAATEKPDAEPAAAPKTEPPISAPAATAPGAPKKAPGNAPAPGAGQRQTSQNINNYVRGIAASLNAEPDKAKKMALAKELVNFMADRKDYPEWQNALATAQQIIKKGVADPNFSNSAINRLKTGQMMEAWQAYWINKLLESIGFTFKDLGFTLLKENKKNGKYILEETKFYKLNMIFESLLTEAESVEQWLKRWLPAYLRGIPISDTTTQSLIKAAGNSYDPKNIQPFRSAMTKLGNAVFATAKAPGYSGDEEPAGSFSGAAAGAAGIGSGRSDPTSGAGTAPAKTGTSTDTIINSIQSQLAKLKGIDPALYADIIKKIGGGQSLQGLPGKTSPATSSSAPTAGSASPTEPTTSPAGSGALTSRPSATPKPTSTAVATSTPPAEVGTTSATGGSTFSSPGVTRHKAASGREQMQQQARAAADAARQARAAAQAGSRPKLAGPTGKLPGPSTPPRLK